MALKLVSKGLVSVVLVIVMLGVLYSGAAVAEDVQDGQYKSSVFGLLFGKLLNDSDERPSMVQKDVPYDYVEHIGQEGGEFYGKANLSIIDRYTGKKVELVLLQDKIKTFDNMRFKLLKCWQKDVDGVSNDARALLLLNADSSIAAKGMEGSRIWLFARYPSLSHEDARYELMLQGCFSGSEGSDLEEPQQ
ncbi:MAG: DUF2155 domain-containing protein [Proteobacteria bacterium]|nr:DUF2155 domain-containing protein [Pseudomonadota bacterium]